MRKRFHSTSALLLSALLLVSAAPETQATAYDGHPKLIVLLVIDQFRADYLQRYRSEFKGRGFRLFLDRGAYFPECYYGYANTKTAPGHATLGTGAYSDGHGINSNEWWDLTRSKQHPVSSVEDARYTLVGPQSQTETQTGAASTPVGVEQEEANSVPPSSGASAAQTSSSPAPANSHAIPGASPRNLLASTLGDELRLATGGVSEVYGVSLKDRAAILPAGASANGAFWIDAATGRFLTSSYYMDALPQWALDFDSGPAITEAATAANVPQLTNFYQQVGSTDAANGYELAFSEALIAGEALGTHAAPDLITISLSPNDLEGHQHGPDSPEEHAMVLGLDHDLDAFATWLDTHVPGGLANVWIALSADHGIAPTPAVSAGLGLPGAYISTPKLTADLNRAMNAKFSPGENVEYVLAHQELPYLSLNQPEFERAGINEQEAEDAVKAAMGPAFTSLAAPAPEPGKAADATSSQAGAPGSTPGGSLPQTSTGNPASAAAQGSGSVPPTTTSIVVNAPLRPAPNPQLFRTYTRQQLAAGELPPTEFGHLMAHSYSPNGGWYVAVFPIAYQMEGYGAGGTTHFSPWSYDRHVPLGLYGAPFLPGTYRSTVEPVDLAVTLASLLGINRPSAAVGHVLTQALRPTPEFAYPKEPVAPRRTRNHRGAKAAADTTGTTPPTAPVSPATDSPSSTHPAVPAGPPQP